MSLRIKLLMLFIVLALIPLAIAGRTMIRITRDELKSSANDNLIAAANQVTQDIENFCVYTWLAPLKLIKKALDSKYMEATEKLSLLTEEMKGVTDIAAIQVSIQGTSSPILVTQDNFSERLKKISLSPEKILELKPEQIAELGKTGDIFAGELTYLAQLDTWLITVILRLDDSTFHGTATLSARISLDRLLRHIRSSPFTETAMISLIDSSGCSLFERAAPTPERGRLFETVRGLLAANIRTMGTGVNVLPSGERILGAYAFPNSLKVGVIVEIKESDAYLAVTKMEWNLILYVLFGVVIAFAGAIAVSIWLTKPLRRLTHAAQKISQGDFSAAADMKFRRSKDEVGKLSATFVEMGEALKESYKTLGEYSRTLEQRVEERTEKLKTSLVMIGETQEKMMESLRYAKMIQMSLLTNQEKLKERLPESFFLWLPREIVGGDIIFTDFFEDGFIAAVIDCTGHGVPGAFMTLIASSGLNRIVRDEKCHDPGEILRRLNFIVKTSLHQDSYTALSDDGMDAVICFISQPNGSPRRTLTVAGARLSLICIHNDEVTVIKGDRQSIGYKKSKLDFAFTNQTLRVENGMIFYMATDGFPDQIGGESGRRMGNRQFIELLKETGRRPFGEQKDILFQALEAYRGEYERQDDVTVVGFGIND